MHEKIYDRFMEKAIKRVAAIKQGNPLDTVDDDRRPGLVSEQLEKIHVLHGYRPSGRC